MKNIFDKEKMQELHCKLPKQVEWFYDGINFTPKVAPAKVTGEYSGIISDIYITPSRIS